MHIAQSRGAIIHVKLRTQNQQMSKRSDFSLVIDHIKSGWIPTKEHALPSTYEFMNKSALQEYPVQTNLEAYAI